MAGNKVKRMIIWTIVGLILVGGAGAAALQVAIARDGPGVLSTLDRFAGGAGSAERKAVISTGDHPQQKLVVWGPGPGDAISPRRPVLLFVHGGSWRSGDPASYDFIASAFVPKGFIVVLVGYRLGESGAYPAMLEDTAAAIAWTRRNITDYAGNPDHIVLAGHSAGAYNVVTVALEERWLAAEGLSTRAVAGAVGLSGPYDFYPFDSDSTRAAFGHATDPEGTQPIVHVRSDAPPMLLIHGEKDDLVKVLNTRALSERIGQAGGDVTTRYSPQMEHNDPLISLAEPWRSRRDLADLIAEFAHTVTDGNPDRDTVSVPVQAETR